MSRAAFCYLIDLAMKRLLVLLLLLVASPVFADSGACSYHGGVNCGASGVYATCNDGTTSSVLYSSMVECQSSYSGCTLQFEADQEQQLCQSALTSQQAYCSQMREAQASEGLYGPFQCDTSTPSVCLQAQYCQEEVNDYGNQIQGVTQQSETCPSGYYLDKAGNCDLSTTATQPRDYAEWAAQQAPQPAPTPAPIVQTPIVPVIQPSAPVVPVVDEKQGSVVEKKVVATTTPLATTTKVITSPPVEKVSAPAGHTFWYWLNPLHWL